MESEKVKFIFPVSGFSDSGKMFNKLKKLKLFFFIIFITLNTMVSAEENEPLYSEFTQDKISSFTCSLVESGEYYRAYVELLRLNSYYPSSVPASVFSITSNYLFYKSKKYTDLLEFDAGAIQEDIFIPVSLFRIDSLIKLNRKEEAESELLKLYGRKDSKKYSGYLNKRSAYLAIMNNNNSSINPQNDLSEYDELFTFSENIYESRKNPYLGALAGIIPGMGFVYAGETGTGIVAMIIVGAGSAVTYASYRDGWDSLAVISGAITFFFYGGSILGGYMQTKRYNDSLVTTLEMKLKRELMPERDLDEIYFKFGLSSNDCK